MAGIRHDPTKHARRNPATGTGRYRIPAIVAFSPLVIFLCLPNAEKYFRENHFFWKWFRRKYFTTNTILCQNKRRVWDIFLKRSFLHEIAFIFYFFYFFYSIFYFLFFLFSILYSFFFFLLFSLDSKNISLHFLFLATLYEFIG
jgi:hypothetical protein